MARRFEHDIRVRSYELDFLGHVNNAVYLNWLEQARLAAFEEAGFGVATLLEGEWLTNVARIEIDYRRPTHFGERLRITSGVERIGRTSLTLRHGIRRLDDGELVSEARVVVVWLDGSGSPVPVPEVARRRFTEGGEESDEGERTGHRSGTEIDGDGED